MAGCVTCEPSPAKKILSSATCPGGLAGRLREGRVEILEDGLDDRRIAGLSTTRTGSEIGE
jgi:hypothetical protein